jgi:hypothetical protein
MGRDRAYWSLTLAFVLAGLLVSAFIQADFWQALNAGLSITDVTALAHSLQEVKTFGLLLEIRRYDLFGLMVLYAPGYRIGPWLYPVVNAGLLLLAAFIYKQLVIDKPGLVQSFPVAMLGVVANPFLLLTMAGPNKELPLLAITLGLCWVLVEKPRGWLLAGVCLALLAGAFRDGFGAILLAFVFLHAVALRFGLSERGTIVLVLLLCAVLLPAMQWAAEWMPVVRRNLEAASRIAQQPQLAVAREWMPVDVLVTWGAWLKRCLLNALSLAVFPVLSQKSGSVYWIGVGYWLFGIANLFALVSAFFIGARAASAQSPGPGHFLATFWLALWLMLSVSLYVQPRYLMVIAPVGIGLLSALSTRVRVASTLVIATAVAAVLAYYQLRGIGLPAVDADTFRADPYRW